MVYIDGPYREVSQAFPEWMIPVIIILVLWTAFWKGVSMWYAAKRNDTAWFVILMLFNTLGILDMYYLFGVAKIKSDKLLKK